jgi:hypothetical protein
MKTTTTTTTKATRHNLHVSRMHYALWNDVHISLKTQCNTFKGAKITVPISNTPTDCAQTLDEDS